MELYYTIVFFVLGTVLGSFYNVVGYRLPKGESLISPPSHCPNCLHRLTPLELIPIFSFLFQRGKCKNCKQKISWFYPIFELSSGLLFALSYYLFGFSWEFAIALVFISVLLIVIISDYQTYIICDEVLLMGTIFIALLLFLQGGISLLGSSLLSGIGAFLTMFLIKKMGDFLFKKESMGGGDIKLMFVFGLVLGYPMATISIFLASFLALPISLLIMVLKKDHVIPFGPFLSISAMILLLTQLEWSSIVSFISSFA